MYVEVQETIPATFILDYIDGAILDSVLATVLYDAECSAKVFCNGWSTMAMAVNYQRNLNCRVSGQILDDGPINLSLIEKQTLERTRRVASGPIPVEVLPWSATLPRVLDRIQVSS